MKKSVLSIDGKIVYLNNPQWRFDLCGQPTAFGLDDSGIFWKSHNGKNWYRVASNHIVFDEGEFNRVNVRYGIKPLAQTNLFEK